MLVLKILLLKIQIWFDLMSIKMFIDIHMYL